MGLLAALTLPILDVLQAGYAFMLPFALWELLIAANAAKTREPLPSTEGDRAREAAAVRRLPDDGTVILVGDPRVRHLGRVCPQS